VPDRREPSNEGFRIEVLAKPHDRGRFTCGVQALDRYLGQQARQDVERHVAAPLVLVEPPSTEVLGYYTLSASVVDVSDIADELARRLPRYPQLPVTLIGRLAVATRLRGRGCGGLLLMDALHRSAIHAAEIAAMAVVVDAKDEKAADFYRRFDFRPLQKTPKRLYLPMKTVEALFG
jgi:predicted GNAT family N-acyltransferase